MTMRTLKLGFFICAATVWVLSLVAVSLLETAFLGYPRTPNVAEGKTEPYKVKGIVVYVTKSETDVLHFLKPAQVVSLGLIVIAGAVNLKWPFQGTGPANRRN